MRGISERRKDKHTQTHTDTRKHFCSKTTTQGTLMQNKTVWLDGLYVNHIFSKSNWSSPDIIIPSPLVSSKDWRVFRCPRPLGDIDPRESGHRSFYVSFIAVSFLLLKILIASAKGRWGPLCSLPLFHFRLETIDVSTSISSRRLRLCCGVILGVSRQCGGC